MNTRTDEDVLNINQSIILVLSRPLFCCFFDVFPPTTRDSIARTPVLNPHHFFYQKHSIWIAFFFFGPLGAAEAEAEAEAQAKDTWSLNLYRG